MNYLLIILGAVSLGLGVTGMFLPVLPTTPFLLLTAWCWLKGSPRLYAWLMSQPRLGPYIRDFQEHRCISRKVKAISVSTLWVTVTVSIVLVHPLWLRILLFCIAVGVTVHILSFKPIIGTTAIKHTIRRHTNNEKLSLNSVIMSRPANCPCIFPYKLISFYILGFSLEWTNF